MDNNFERLFNDFIKDTGNQYMSTKSNDYYFYKMGKEQSRREMRDKVLDFFATHVTHACEKGIIVNIPTYSELVERLLSHIGIFEP